MTRASRTEEPAINMELKKKRSKPVLSAAAPVVKARENTGSEILKGRGEDIGFGDQAEE